MLQIIISVYFYSIISKSEFTQIPPQRLQLAKFPEHMGVTLRKLVCNMAKLQANPIKNHRFQSNGLCERCSDHVTNFGRNP